MEIKRITVVNLFELYNHDIPFKTNEHITIMYGLNGIGKTIILRMLNGLFNRNYSLFRSIPFNEFLVEFSNDRALKVIRDIHSETKKNSHPRIEYTEDNKTRIWELAPAKYSGRFDLDFADEIPELHRIGPRTWRSIPTGEIFSLDEVSTRYEEYMPEGARQARAPEWLTKVQNSLDIRFLDVERLLGTTRRRRAWEEQMQRKPAVNQYSEELANNIQKKYGAYAELSQSLDRSFPRRLLEHPKPKQISSSALRRKLEQLEIKRRQLVDAGVLGKETIEERIPEQIRAQDRNLLSVYLSDTERKLKVFDELARKLDVLRTTINNRFQNKQMAIDRKKGFVFTSAVNRVIRPIDLSSGEQHEIVMLYELLFKVKPGTLFLIDEPELSLHVAWQVQLISDLQKIAKLGGFQVLMATHSPQIVNERWDLTAELKEPNE